MKYRAHYIPEHHHRAMTSFRYPPVVKLGFLLLSYCINYSLSHSSFLNNLFMAITKILSFVGEFSPQVNLAKASSITVGIIFYIFIRLMHIFMCTAHPPFLSAPPSLNHLCNQQCTMQYKTEFLQQT